jgi:hypothetical protein
MSEEWPLQNYEVDEQVTLKDTITKLRRQNEIMKKAHTRTVEVVEEMLDRFTTEAVANPTRQDGHYAMVQLLHCHKRSKGALKECEELK